MVFFYHGARGKGGAESRAGRTRHSQDRPASRTSEGTAGKKECDTLSQNVVTLLETPEEQQKQSQRSNKLE